MIEVHISVTSLSGVGHIGRDLVYVTLDVDKARISHLPFKQPDAVHLLAEFGRRFIQSLLILDAVRGELLQSPIITVNPHLVLLRFHPAAWSEMVESLTVERGPVTDSAAKTASVDVVKRRVVGPFGFGVVDFELDIRWYPVVCQALSIGELATARFGLPAGLYGRQIHPNDFGARILTGKRP